MCICFRTLVLFFYIEKKMNRPKYGSEKWVILWNSLCTLQTVYIAMNEDPHFFALARYLD